jgi:hypothetical protein
VHAARPRTGTALTAVARRNLDDRVASRDDSPAIVMRSSRIEPVSTCERGSTARPTATTFAYMQRRLPAIVTSWIG